MIKILTDMSNIKMEDCLFDSESYFNYIIRHWTLNEDSEKAMSEIDNARLIDKKMGTIVTPYGTTDLTHLSTGCKTVITFLYLAEKGVSKILNATEAGTNALEVLFNYAEKYNSDITFLMLQTPEEGCSSHEFCVDGIISHDLVMGVLFHEDVI